MNKVRLVKNRVPTEMTESELAEYALVGCEIPQARALLCRMLDGKWHWVLVGKETTERREAGGMEAWTGERYASKVEAIKRFAFSVKDKGQFVTLSWDEVGAWWTWTGCGKKEDE